MLSQSRLCVWTIGLLVVFTYQLASASEPQWWTDQKRACNLSPSLAYNDWVRSGSPCNRNNGGNSNDNGAADRARAEAAAAAAAQRQRDAELEQQRIEADNKRRMEEIANQARFIDDRDAAASTLRGSTGVEASGRLGNSELRGSSATSELRGSNPDTAPTPNLDPMVVDARNVPSGLPKSVEDSIPNTPAGDRVRKGFQAIQVHDWKAALAWFQDALNHEPGDPSLKRLVDLARFTLDYRLKIGAQVPGQSKQSPQNSTNKSPSGSAVTPGMDIEHVDFLAYEGAVMIAARARGTAAAEQFDKKHDPHATALDRTAAVQKAVRGEGYSKEELNRGIQEALVVVNKERHDRQVHQKAGPDRVGLKNNPPTPARSYPDTPWGTVLRLLDADPKQPNVYLGPTADELAAGKG
jgi:hypothetical protein